MIFFYEYLPSLLPAVYPRVHRDDLEVEFPLIVSWTRALAKSSKDTYKKVGKDVLLDLVQNADEINWQPFANLPADFLPPHLEAQLDVALSSTIVMCFDQMGYHFPFLCPAKWGRNENNVNNWRSIVALNERGRQCPDKFDWRVKCAAQIEEWNRRMEHLIFYELNDVEEPPPTTPTMETDHVVEDHSNFHFDIENDFVHLHPEARLGQLDGAGIQEESPSHEDGIQEDALCDLGAIINLMSRYIKKSGFWRSEVDNHYFAAC